jgi:hypothetical protein
VSLHQKKKKVALNHFKLKKKGREEGRKERVFYTKNLNFKKRRRKGRAS